MLALPHSHRNYWAERTQQISYQPLPTASGSKCLLCSKQKEQGEGEYLRESCPARALHVVLPHEPLTQKRLFLCVGWADYFIDKENINQPLYGVRPSFPPLTWNHSLHKNDARLEDKWGSAQSLDTIAMRSCPF